MKILTEIPDLRAARQALVGPVVLVPTMGALHAGHVSLVELARSVAGADGTVAASIFVNPIQFDRPHDLAAYPRNLEGDLAACETAGVDLVFLPSAEAMYAPDRSIHVTETALSQTLCGATRPGHFAGVCTVVLKLFNLVQPTAAVFGKKDYQQLAILRRLVRDLDVPVEIHAGETLREPDGLAMSSRNVRLHPAARAAAPCLRRALLAVRDAGGTSAERIAAGREVLAAATPAPRIDYFEIVDRETLQPLPAPDRPALAAAAVFFDDVRLIDNLELDPS